MTIDPVLTWGFLGVGIFGQCFALMLAWRPIRVLRAGGKAQGVITGNDEDVIAGARGSARTFFFPQIAFTTANGERISFKSRSGRGIAMAPGTSIALIYDPARPHEALVKSFSSLWFFPLALSLFSLPFLVVGLLGALA